MKEGFIIKKIYWKNVLPTKQCGNNINIKWKDSIGYNVKFVYDDIQGELKIIDYKDGCLYIKYLDYDIFKIDSTCFKHCKIGGLIRQRTNEFKVKIGEKFKDKNRDLTIMDTKKQKDKSNREWKLYKYHCNRCGNEDWIKENHLLNGENCNVCCASSKKVVLGINTIWDTDRWMCDLGVSEKDAKTHTSHSNQKITVTCPLCKRIKKITVNNICNYKSINCICSDNISYPEKIMFNILEQLKVDFKTQLSKTTFKWCEKYYYDFYFEYNNQDYIIETHGKQHYNGGFSSYGGRTLKEEQENDKYKKQLALNNGIKEENYIILDCRESNLEFIKQNILDSQLTNLFDLSQIDWFKCEEFALKNIVKEVCDYWNLHNKKYISLIQIGKVFNIHINTVSTYLKKGSKLEWCDYSPKKHKMKSCTRLNRTINKVEILKNNKSLGIFINCAELSRKSKKLFGIYLIAKGISSVCRKERKTYKGFTFKYVT